MTPEQLDEIEKLAEAATPGPWKFQRRNGVWAYAREDLAFMEAMREHALPLVKALREARQERDEARAEVERLRGIVEVNDRRLAAVWDEARAEVERLKAALHCTQNELSEHYCIQCEGFVRP